MGLTGHKQSMTRQMRRQEQWAFVERLAVAYREASQCRAVVVYEPAAVEKAAERVNVLPAGKPICLMQKSLCFPLGSPAPATYNAEKLGMRLGDESCWPRPILPFWAKSSYLAGSRRGFERELELTRRGGGFVA